MERIEGGAQNAAACASGIIATAALGTFALVNPLGFAAMAMTPGVNTTLASATAAGATAIAAGC